MTYVGIGYNSSFVITPLNPLIMCIKKMKEILNAIWTPTKFEFRHGLIMGPT